MRILIVSPSSAVRNGNAATASQWAEDFRALGHEVRVRESEVRVRESFGGEMAELLVVLHGAKSRRALDEFRAAQPDGKVVIALTGTDLYPALSESAAGAVSLADRVVALQSGARERVPPEHRWKVRIIPLAAAPPAAAPERGHSDGFLVSVVGNLREVKDPMRTAAASRLLPPESRVMIVHAGGILEDRFAEAARREQRENPRYRWLGEVTPAEAQRLIAESDLFVLSSYHEGGARVLSEAAVAGTPILGARSDATVSALGADYPGLFAAGDTERLARLLRRAETDSVFLDDLRARVHSAASQFDPARETEAWQNLLDEFAIE